jgi:GT2 family glycosyltransferase
MSDAELSIHASPLVSIIVPNWNGKRTLKACLQSLGRLKYPNYEVIVVDDASTDGSAQMVSEILPEARLILNERNLGFAATCNKGINASKGEYIVLFNNDAVASPSWLSELMKVMLSTPNLAVVSGPVLYHKTNIVWSAGARIDAFTGVDWHIGRGETFEHLHEIDDVDYVSGCAMVLRRSIVNKIGGFDERFFFYGEDADWNFTVKRLDFKCSIVKPAIAWHIIPIGGRQLDARKYYFYARGIFRLYLKHFPVKYLPTAIFFQLIVLPLLESVIFKQPANRLLIRMKALTPVLAEAREILQKRRINRTFGELYLRQRLAECLKVACNHFKSRQIDY